MSTARLRAALVAASLVTTGFGAVFSSGHAAVDVRTDFPAANCQTIKDREADAHLVIGYVPNDTDLDIKTLTLRTAGTDLVAYIKVADLKPGPTAADGHRYSLSFTYAGHSFTASSSHYKTNSGTARESLAGTGQAAKVTQLVVDPPGTTEVPESPADANDKGFKNSGLNVTFDESNDYVVMTLPISDIVQYAGGGAFSGELTKLDATSAIDYYARSSVADTATDTSTPTPVDKWRVGDNKCWTVATRLALSVAKTPASRTVTARLTSADGRPLTGMNVVFSLNGRKYATVRTSGAGTAVLRNLKPGYRVTAQFVAMPGYLGCTASTKI